MTPVPSEAGRNMTRARAKDAVELVREGVAPREWHRYQVLLRIRHLLMHNSGFASQ